MNTISLIQALLFVLQLESVPFAETLQCTPGASFKTKHTRLPAPLTTPKWRTLPHNENSAEVRKANLCRTTERAKESSRLMVRLHSADINFRNELSQLLSLLCDSL